jgi:hypothetical protein
MDAVIVRREGVCCYAGTPYSPVVILGWIRSVDNEASHLTTQDAAGTEVRLLNCETQDVLGCPLCVSREAQVVCCGLDWAWCINVINPLTSDQLHFFLILVCEAIGTAATPGLLCQPQVIVKMIVEKHMECRLAGETEVLGENLPQRHFCPSQNPIWPDPGLNPGRRGGKPATNRLSYGAVYQLN